MGKFNAWLKHVVITEPVLVISVGMCVIGLGLPLIVPPIRNALSRPEQPPPPKLKDVVSGMTGKPLER